MEVAVGFFLSFFYAGQTTIVAGKFVKGAPL
jgi:hypothetical protein